jgi:hypothetical protein
MRDAKGIDTSGVQRDKSLKKKRVTKSQYMPDGSEGGEKRWKKRGGKKGTHIFYSNLFEKHRQIPSPKKPPTPRAH